MQFSKPTWPVSLSGWKEAFITQLFSDYCHISNAVPQSMLDICVQFSLYDLLKYFSALVISTSIKYQLVICTSNTTTLRDNDAKEM